MRQREVGIVIAGPTVGTLTHHRHIERGPLADVDLTAEGFVLEADTRIGRIAHRAAEAHGATATDNDIRASAHRRAAIAVGSVTHCRDGLHFPGQRREGGPLHAPDALIAVTAIDVALRCNQRSRRAAIGEHTDQTIGIAVADQRSIPCGGGHRQGIDLSAAHGRSIPGHSQHSSIISGREGVGIGRTGLPCDGSRAHVSGERHFHIAIGIREGDGGTIIVDLAVFPRFCHAFGPCAGRNSGIPFHSFSHSLGGEGYRPGGGIHGDIRVDFAIEAEDHRRKLGRHLHTCSHLDGGDALGSSHRQRGAFFKANRMIHRGICRGIAHFIGGPGLDGGGGRTQSRNVGDSHFTLRDSDVTATGIGRIQHQRRAGCGGKLGRGSLCAAEADREVERSFALSRGDTAAIEGDFHRAVAALAQRGIGKRERAAFREGGADGRTCLIGMKLVPERQGALARHLHRHLCIGIPRQDGRGVQKAAGDGKVTIHKCAVSGRSAEETIIVIGCLAHREGAAGLRVLEGAARGIARHPDIVAVDHNRIARFHQQIGLPIITRSKGGLLVSKGDFPGVAVRTRAVLRYGIVAAQRACGGRINPQVYGGIGKKRRLHVRGRSKRFAEHEGGTFGNQIGLTIIIEGLFKGGRACRSAEIHIITRETNREIACECRGIERLKQCAAFVLHAQGELARTGQDDLVGHEIERQEHRHLVITVQFKRMGECACPRFGRGGIAILDERQRIQCHGFILCKGIRIGLRLRGRFNHRSFHNLECGQTGICATINRRREGDFHLFGRQHIAHQGIVTLHDGRGSFGQIGAAPGFIAEHFERGQTAGSIDNRVSGHITARIACAIHSIGAFTNLHRRIGSRFQIAGKDQCHTIGIKRNLPQTEGLLLRIAEPHLQHRSGCFCEGVHLGGVDREGGIDGLGCAVAHRHNTGQVALLQACGRVDFVQIVPRGDRLRIDAHLCRRRA